VPPELSKLIMSKEWFVPNAVNDYGQKTIGYGTAANGRTSITEPEARAEMNAQLQQHLSKIDANFPNLPPAVRNSVASLTFNVGEGWMSEPGNHLAAALKAGNMPAAKQAFMQYVHVTDSVGNKSVLPGLVNRRTDEARAFDGQQPLYTRNPDAPAAAPAATLKSPEAMLRDVAAPSKAGTVETGPAAPNAPSAAQPAVAAPVAPNQAAAAPLPSQAAVPYAGVGGLQSPEDAVNTTGTATYDAGAAALNKIQPPAAAPAPAAVATAAPAAVPSPPAAAPPPPVRTAPPPPTQAAPVRPSAPPPLTPAQVAKPLTGYDKAKAMVDLPLSKILTPEELKQVPANYQAQSPRQIYNTPMIGGIAFRKMAPLFSSRGFTPDDAMKALSEPPPGKRSDAGTSNATDFSARARTPSATPLPPPPSAAAPQPTTSSQPPPNQPSIPPEMAKALEMIFKQPDAGPAMPTPANALPVPGVTDSPDGASGLNLAPPGLQAQADPGPQVAPGAPMQMMQASQGNPIAMAGLMPMAPAQQFPTPSANLPGSSGLSPIAPDFQTWNTPDFSEGFSMPMDL